MIKVRIMTNNPMVSNIPGAEYEDISLLEVLERVRDQIHLNYRLLTHPMAGSVKPNETPYKSVILAALPDKEMDVDSLKIIEAAIILSTRLMQDRPTPLWNDKVRADFALVDFSLVQSGLGSFQHF